MSDNEKDSAEENKEVEETDEVVDVADEVNQEVEKEGKVRAVSNFKYSPFVSEDDLFKISVEFYREGVKVYVKGITDNYDVSHEDKDVIDITLKYPDQGDQSAIASGSNFIGDDIDVTQFTRLELSRMMLLIRSWNLEENCRSQEAIMRLHSHIIKSVLEGIREEINVDGII